MNKLSKINRGFFKAILYSFKDLDKSISEQIEIRNRESQLLPLLYFTCLILLLSQLIQVTSQVQRAPYLSVITAVIVSHLFFLPIFMYITSFILHLGNFCGLREQSRLERGSSAPAAACCAGARVSSRGPLSDPLRMRPRQRK